VPADSSVIAVCPLCGSPTNGAPRCPSCGLFLEVADPASPVFGRRTIGLFAAGFVVTYLAVLLIVLIAR
jgi:hypothetical protein